MKGSFIVLDETIRFDTRIPSDAKLLYGEIVLKCRKEGRCWASNAYFAELYSVTVRTVQRWVAALRNAGYITITLHYVDDTHEIEIREIRLCEEKSDLNKNITTDSDVIPPMTEIVFDGQGCHGDMAYVSGPPCQMSALPHDTDVVEIIKNSKIKKEKEKRKKEIFVFGFSKNKKNEGGKNLPKSFRREKPDEIDGIDPPEKQNEISEAVQKKSSENGGIDFSENGLKRAQLTELVKYDGEGNSDAMAIPSRANTGILKDVSEAQKSGEPKKAKSLEDATTLFQTAKDFWNSLALKPECRDLLIPPSKYGCLRTFQTYSLAEIKNAIQNYDWHVKGRCGDGFKPPPPYGSLFGFLENGVARYFDDDAIDAQFKEAKHGT
jgi:hypothetical protein